MNAGIRHGEKFIHHQAVQLPQLFIPDVNANHDIRQVTVSITKDNKTGIGRKIVMRPVILSAFGPPALACIRSWGQQGWEPGLICIRSDEESGPASRYLSGWTTLSREKVHTDEGIELIAEFLAKFNADGIIAIDEKVSIWINKHRDKFPRKTAIWLQDNAVIENVLSKERQTEVAKAVGLNVLPTYLLSPKNEILIAPEHFPLCLRPSEPGGAGFKVKIVSSREELAQFLGGCPHGFTIIGQPFMSLPNLVVHGARSHTGATLGIQGFLVARKFEGVTLTITPIASPLNIFSKCIDFTNAFNIVGNYHFEFLFDPNTEAAYFLEINSRLGGTTAKVFPCGYNEPVIALESFGITPNIQRAVEPLPVTVSNKQALIKYLYYALGNRLGPLDYPEEPMSKRIYKTLRGFMTYRDDVISISDMRGSLALYFGNLKAKLKSA